MFLIQDVKTDFLGCKHLPVSPTSRALEMFLLSTHPADSHGVWLCCQLLQSLSGAAHSSPALDPYLAAPCQSASEIKGKRAWRALQSTAPCGKVCAQTRIPAQQPACLALPEPSLPLICVVLSSPAPDTLPREHPAWEGRAFDGKAHALPSLPASRSQSVVGKGTL